jgi:enoyl-CoA hydratase/carnithine racemase
VYFYVDFRFTFHITGEAARVNIVGRQGTLAMKMMYSAKGMLDPLLSSEEKEKLRKAFYSAVNEYVHAILTSGPEAVAMAKKLVSSVPTMAPEEFIPYTAEMIARLRISAEGQEGMDAFLNKRTPNWVSKPEKK